MQRFLIKLLLLTFLTAGLYRFAGSFIDSHLYYSNFIWLPFFIATVTAILHRGLMQRKGESKQFIRYYMGATGVKLFIYLMVIIAVAFIDKPRAVSFSLCFFFFYLSFTIFEVAESYGSFGGTSGGNAEGKTTG